MDAEKAFTKTETKTNTNRHRGGVENNMKQKTALQEFLEQIVLKQVQGSVFLLPAITDIQIQQALEIEREQIKDAFVSGSLRGKGEIPFNCEQFYSQTYETNPTQE